MEFLAHCGVGIYSMRLRPLILGLLEKDNVTAQVGEISDDVVQVVLALGVEAAPSEWWRARNGVDPSSGHGQKTQLLGHPSITVEMDTGADQDGPRYQLDSHCSTTGEVHPLAFWYHLRSKNLLPVVRILSQNGYVKFRRMRVPGVWGGILLYTLLCSAHLETIQASQIVLHTT